MKKSLDKKDIYLLVFLLLITAFTHGFNMFHFPYYENDEGTYMSQAWSLLRFGKLAPYTYWYDHAPLGWMVIALWVKLSGGFFTFGPAINSGRVLMLILHLISSFFVYFITKRLSGSRLASTVSVLFFSLTPIGIYFQRRVLLDNIMTFFILATVAFLYVKKLTLKHFIVSALLFGASVLAKENAIFFAPGLILLIFQKAHRKNISFAIVLWLVITGSIISLYFLFALLKGEFFPAHTLLGGNTDHVSFIESLKYQVSRPGGSIFDKNSIFWQYTRLWFGGDALLISLGAVTTFLITVIGIFKRKYLPFALFNLFFILFLVRGGTIIEFYIVPLIPFAAITIGVLINEIIDYLKKPLPSVISWFSNAVIPVSIIVYYAVFGQIAHGFNIYFSDQVKPQMEATKWISDHVPQKDIVIIDNYAYVDMNDNKSPLSKTFVNSEWYWKVDRDIEIKDGLLKDDPSNISVVAMTPQMDADLTQGQLNFLSKSINSARPIKRFWNDGWGVEIWYTNYPNQILARTWDSYKQKFISEDGKVKDPSRGNITTSEGQSYALLRSLYVDDKNTFDALWDWTKNNMKNSQGLFGWKWGNRPDGSSGLLDGGTASDGDTDIALALALAYKKWGDEKYLNDAKTVTQNIWDYEVKEISDKPYMVVGNWAKDKELAYINPSYLNPAAYRIFAIFDNKHPWNLLADVAYDVLNGCSSAPLDKDKSSYLPPDWCSTDGETYNVIPESGINNTDYSFDAFRTYYRVALDYHWFGSERAKDYLTSSSFVRNQWKNIGKVYTSYTHDGNTIDGYESVAAYAGVLGNALITDPQMAKDIYNKKISPKFYENEKQSYWEDPNNYYTQNWAWLATALYSGSMVNYWSL